MGCDFLLGVAGGVFVGAGGGGAPFVGKVIEAGGVGVGVAGSVAGGGVFVGALVAVGDTAVVGVRLVGGLPRRPRVFLLRGGLGTRAGTVGQDSATGTACVAVGVFLILLAYPTSAVAVRLEALPIFPV